MRSAVNVNSHVFTQSFLCFCCMLHNFLLRTQSQTHLLFVRLFGAPSCSHAVQLFVYEVKFISSNRICYESVPFTITKDQIKLPNMNLMQLVVVGVSGFVDISHWHCDGNTCDPIRSSSSHSNRKDMYLTWLMFELSIFLLKKWFKIRCKTYEIVNIYISSFSHLFLELFIQFFFFFLK